jgi:hypothetical protein
MLAMIPGDRRLSGIVLAVLLGGILVRLGVLGWSDPWTPHHPDEHILPLEALAMWEGVTPREIGWPASTTRLALSAANALRAATECGPAIWAARQRPDQAAEVLARWIGDQYVNPGALYGVGRLLSLFVGVLQLLAGVWALRQWTGPRGVAAGTLALALSPLAVLYSQFVLADIWGVLFATILVGLAARPTAARVVVMAALAGLAAASKFHFGIWLLTALLCVPGLVVLTARQRGLLALAALASFGAVVVALVPWFWTNPALAAKEFAAVVLMKVSANGAARDLPGNLITVLGGAGALTWGGALLAAWGTRGDWPRIARIGLPVIVALLFLVSSATVSDRYGLVLLPGLAPLAAFGWERLLSIPGGWRRSLGIGVLAACGVWTAVSLGRAERTAAETDVDVLARRWVLQHVPRGARVAVYHESNAFLPRDRATLEACAAQAQTPSALVEKWRIHGIVNPDVRGGALYSALLNDELFHAYWCRRELGAQTDVGYRVIQYHPDLRFGALSERAAVRSFANRRTDREPVLDVLMINRAADLGAPAAAVMRTGRGIRLLYVRPGLARR